MLLLIAMVNNALLILITVFACVVQAFIFIFGLGENIVELYHFSIVTYMLIFHLEL